MEYDRECVACGHKWQEGAKQDTDCPECCKKLRPSPTPPAEFRAKLRWQPDGEGYRLYAGKKLMGCVAQICIGHQKYNGWSHNGSGRWSRDYPDLAAAQTALVAAVMEMQGE